MYGEVVWLFSQKFQPDYKLDLCSYGQFCSFFSMSGPDFGCHMVSTQSTNILSHSDVIANSGR